MFSIFYVGRSFWPGHFKSGLQAKNKSVGTPALVQINSATKLFCLFFLGVF